MANTIHQPSANPTNKLSASTAATAAWGMVMSIGSLLLKVNYPEYYDPEMLLAIGAGVPTVVCYAAGWFTSDAPNVVVVVEDNQ